MGYGTITDITWNMLSVLKASDCFAESLILICRQCFTNLLESVPVIICKQCFSYKRDQQKNLQGPIQLYEE